MYDDLKWLPFVDQVIRQSSNYIKMKEGNNMMRTSMDSYLSVNLLTWIFAHACRTCMYNLSNWVRMLLRGYPYTRVCQRIDSCVNGIKWIVINAKNYFRVNNLMIKAYFFWCLDPLLWITCRMSSRWWGWRCGRTHEVPRIYQLPYFDVPFFLIMNFDKVTVVVYNIAR